MAALICMLVVMLLVVYCAMKRQLAHLVKVHSIDDAIKIEQQIMNSK